MSNPNDSTYLFEEREMVKNVTGKKHHKHRRRKSQEAGDTSLGVKPQGRKTSEPKLDDKYFIDEQGFPQKKKLRKFPVKKTDKGAPPELPITPEPQKIDLKVIKTVKKKQPPKLRRKNQPRSPESSYSSSSVSSSPSPKPTPRKKLTRPKKNSKEIGMKPDLTVKKPEDESSKNEAADIQNDLGVKPGLALKGVASKKKKPEDKSAENDSADIQSDPVPVKVQQSKVSTIPTIKVTPVVSEGPSLIGPQPEKKISVEFKQPSNRKNRQPKSSFSSSGSTPSINLSTYENGIYDPEIEKRITERKTQLKNSQMTQNIRQDEYNEEKLLEMKKSQGDGKSKAAFVEMKHGSNTSLDLELKRGLLTESVITTAPKFTREEKNLLGSVKLYLNELYNDYVLTQKSVYEISDVENELKCFASEETKRVKKFENAILHRDRIHGTWIVHESPWEYRTRIMHRVLKWLVVIVGLSDICFAFEYTYQIIQKQMKYEFFFTEGVYNCSRLISKWYLVGLFAHVAHGVTSTMVLWMEDCKSSQLGLFWIITQLFIWLVLAFEGYIKSRFQNEPVIVVLKHVAWKWLVDIIQLFIIGVRYLKLSGVMEQRMHILAHWNRVKVKRPTLNDELLIQNSKLLQRKDYTRRRCLEQNRTYFQFCDDYNMKHGKLPPREMRAKQIQRCLKNIETPDYEWDLINIRKIMGSRWVDEFEKEKLQNQEKKEQRERKYNAAHGRGQRENEDRKNRKKGSFAGREEMDDDEEALEAARIQLANKQKRRNTMNEFIESND